MEDRRGGSSSYLYIIALVVVAALTEQPVVDDSVDIELIEQGIAVLRKVSEMNI
jgi:hypothetical protein